MIPTDQIELAKQIIEEKGYTYFIIHSITTDSGSGYAIRFTDEMGKNHLIFCSSLFMGSPIINYPCRAPFIGDKSQHGVK